MSSVLDIATATGRFLSVTEQPATTPTPVEPTPTPEPVNVIHSLLYDLPGWPHDNTLLNFLLTLAAWIIIGGVVYWLLFHVLRLMVGQTRADMDNIILRTIRVPVFVAIVAYGVLSSFDELHLKPDISHAIDSLYAATIIGAVFYLGWRITKEVVIKWLLGHAEETETKVDDLMLPLLRTIGPAIFFIAALLFVLQVLGVNIALAAASIGAVGLIFGLAFQDTLSNLFSGIYLILDPPFREGELVTLPDGKVYSVHKIGLRMTQLYDMSNHSLVFTPNSQLTKETIANITKPTVDMKMVSSVSVSARHDPAMVGKLIGDILLSHRNILNEPAAKIQVLRKRAEQLSILGGASSAVLSACLNALEDWRTARGADDEAQDRLLATRKEMQGQLDLAMAAYRKLPLHPSAEKAMHELRHVLGGIADSKNANSDTLASIDAERMRTINQLMDRLEQVYQPNELAPLLRALAALERLDKQEDALEVELQNTQQQHENELDALIDNLMQASQRVSEALRERNLPKEAASVAEWIRTIAVQYTELEVMDSISGLDRELNGIISWLRELEANGLSSQERDRIRSVFGRWGGVRMLEKRRVSELHRRIMRWLEWKEEDKLPDHEYARVISDWERRLRTLSRKLYDSTGGDEDALDTNLANIRQWLHSMYFWEPLPQWKLSYAGLSALGAYTFDYGWGYYVDDIKLEHFGRRGRVGGNVLMDIYETFRREGIDIPVPQQEIWVHEGPSPNGLGDGVTGRRLTGSLLTTTGGLSNPPTGGLSNPPPASTTQSGPLQR